MSESHQVPTTFTCKKNLTFLLFSPLTCIMCLIVHASLETLQVTFQNLSQGWKDDSDASQTQRHNIQNSQCRKQSEKTKHKPKGRQFLGLTGQPAQPGCCAPGQRDPAYGLLPLLRPSTCSHVLSEVEVGHHLEYNTLPSAPPRFVFLPCKKHRILSQTAPKF